jgi:hypothetical protein
MNGDMNRNLATQQWMALIFLLLGVSGPMYAGEVKNSTGGFLDFNFYPLLNEKSDGSIYTLNIGSGLPKRFSYFALVSTNNQQGRAEFEETNGFYIEQNLRWQIAENSPLDLTLQHNMRSNEDNDRLRFGFRWRLNDTELMKTFFDRVNARYSINFHLYQLDHSDDDVWQLEHVWRFYFPYLSDRLYLGGFADQSFGETIAGSDRNSHTYLETQLGYRIIENFYLVTEYRYSQYNNENPDDLAVGFEYKVNW